MKRLFTHSERTLKLSYPFGKTVVLAVFLLAIIAGLLEAAARQPFVQSRLPSRSIASGNLYLEANLQALNELVKDQPVDCIFFGSSFTLRGINPAIFSSSYQAVTGQPIRCYTFGVQGLTASGAGMLGGILEELYHPRLLIYGISPRDIAAASLTNGYTKSDLERIPWIQQHSGKFTVNGWLSVHSVAFGYFLSYSDWTKPNFEEALATRRFLETSLKKTNGYQPISRILTLPLSQAQQDEMDRFYNPYEIEPIELNGLEEIVSLNKSPQLEVVVVQMPVQPLVANEDFFSEEEYNTYKTAILDCTQRHNALYLAFEDETLIPQDGWQDMGHLNSKGATSYSTWLGEEIGKAVNRGDLVFE